MLATKFIKVLRFNHQGMKGIKQIFTVMLAALVSQAVFADDLSDIVRAATRRDTTATVSGAVRQKQTSDNKNTNISSRTTSSNRDSSTVRDRNAAQQNTGRTAATNKNIVSRTATTNTVTNRKNATTGRAITSRTATMTPIAQTSVRQTTSGRSAPITSRSTTNIIPTSTRRARATSVSTARNATTNPDITSITSRDFKSCRDVFHSCMDEFCANKDATLKRCACSARSREFDGMKKQLEKVEDKLLDFSQRLLTVNMDKEDALVLNQATEGELAYDQKDKSESKKLLDSIAKKLNTSFNDSNFDQNLNAISLSLNTDAAFDSIDSLMGASTTTKTGTALYNAALPVCREMAMEVCTAEDLAIAESGYQMTIEQDCNTVAKAYVSQNDQARAKILESGALLDMSRLDIHQKRNSDDILTCKKKMLDMLTDSTVCGTDMSKCLDISGRYINPATGEAILTENLVDLNKLITRPGPNQTWTSAPGNDKFVLFLKNKKKFIEPATENCQNIADSVWDDFIEDALAQIKLAQDAKLEQVRQSCTTLTTQCLDETFKSISEFDARALSIFGVSADKTVNAMCSDIRTACNAVLNIIPGDTSWDTGMTEIITDKTYATILSTCREVGRQCIIQSCKSITGNFGLCENIDTSVNRKSIISRHSCWDKVQQCVADAGEETIKTIMKNQGRAITTGKLTDYKKFGDIYSELYGNDRATFAALSTAAVATVAAAEVPAPISTPEYNGIYDWCGQEDFAKLTSEFDWLVCRLTEQIWGNCEQAPNTDDTQHNKILVNYTPTTTGTDNETLLSWFARNTGTENSPESCRDTTCGYGQTHYNGMCLGKSYFSSDGEYCPTTILSITNSYTNCCTAPAIILSGKNYCCQNGTQTISLTKATNYAMTSSSTTPIDLAEKIDTICTFGNYLYAYAVATIDNELLVCLSEQSSEDQALTYGNEIKCNGYFMYVSQNTPYHMPTNTEGVKNFYTTQASNYCTYGESGWVKPDKTTCDTPNIGWKIEYDIKPNSEQE